MIIALLIIITILLLIIILSNERAVALLVKILATISLVGLIIVILGLIIGAVILFYFIDIEFKIVVLMIPLLFGGLFLIGFATFFSAEKLSRVADKTYEKFKIKIQYRSYFTALVWVATIISIYLLLRLISN